MDRGKVRLRGELQMGETRVHAPVGGGLPSEKARDYVLHRGRGGSLGAFVGGADGV
ncbi:hypothetical protein L484_023662 [Morus notabilis]|uniref:Uncharacterized protein n=1 Tax=Morus notabilis TaxID=981085 RepID=W9RS45_9ROSA|nr:hypothetical protein L484_023662 [Morus notabilis]